MVLLVARVLLDYCFLKPLFLIFQHTCIKLNKYFHSINFQQLTEHSHKIYQSVTKSTHKMSKLLQSSTTSATIATCSIFQKVLKDKGRKPYQYHKKNILFGILLSKKACEESQLKLLAISTFRKYYRVQKQKQIQNQDDLQIMA